MPNSLIDMFNSRDPAGEPSSFADNLQARSNSLIGLGLGLLQPSNPLRGQSSWGNALEGFQAGAGLDARTAALGADRRQHAGDRTQAQANFERTFAENQMTEAEKLARAAGFARGTPEHTAFIQKAIQSKTEGDWIPQTDENTGQQYGYNKRTGETRPISIPGTTATAPADPFTAGTGRPVYGEGGGGFSATQSSAPSSPAGTAPSGQGPIAGKTLREARSKAIIANEEDAVKSARAAAEFKPALDEMTTAYKALVEAGGIGPIQGSTIGRYTQSMTGWNVKNEALRQRYDTAKAKVQAQITAAQNKGEGAVSNFERQMYAAQFPELNAIDPATQLPFLNQLQATTEQTIKAGRGTSLGTAPGTFTRPPIEQPQSPAGSGKGYADAVKALKKNPHRRDEFDAKYGEGAAMRELTGK